MRTQRGGVLVHLANAVGRLRRIGALPDEDEACPTQDRLIISLNVVLSQAIKTFNFGIRGYYYAIATLCLFLSPYASIAATVIVTTILVFILLQWIVTKTKVGMAMRAISYDKFAVPLMGVETGLLGADLKYTLIPLIAGVFVALATYALAHGQQTYAVPIVIMGLALLAGGTWLFVHTRSRKVEAAWARIGTE